MNVMTLRSLLVNDFDAKEADGALEVPQSTRLTVLVTFGQELLRVSKLRRLRIHDDYVAIIGESDAIYVDPDRQFAVKSEGAEVRPDVRPGFH